MSRDRPEKKRAISALTAERAEMDPEAPASATAAPRGAAPDASSDTGTKKGEAAAPTEVGIADELYK